MSVLEQPFFIIKGSCNYALGFHSENCAILAWFSCLHDSSQNLKHIPVKNFRPSFDRVKNELALFGRSKISAEPCKLGLRNASDKQTLKNRKKWTQATGFLVVIVANCSDVKIYYKKISYIQEKMLA